MTPPTPAALAMLLDKQAVTEVLLGYCRAIDRRDMALMRKVYWPDAIDDHAVFRGDVEAFIAYCLPFLDGVVTQHRISNIWIDMTGPDSAFSECYFSAFHDFPAPTGGNARLERIVGGRYCDRHERRGDEWRIIARTVVLDWYHERAGNAVWDSGRYADLPNRGAPWPDDPLYRLHPAARPAG